MSNPSPRLHGLDFLRALMMSLGLVLHAAQMYLTLPIVDYYWDSARSPSMDLTLIVINTFRMPVFYLLSGFFMALLWDRRGAEEMFENRKKRILVPFLLFLPELAIIMTGLRVVAQHVMTTGEFGFDVSLVTDPRILWDNTHNLWFLYYLLLFVATGWAMLKLWPKLPERWRSAIGSAVQGTTIYRSTTFLIVCLGLATVGGWHDAGRVSASLSFIPKLDVYLYFGLCFLLGWVLYLRMQDLKVLSGRWKKDISVATLLLLMALIAFGLKGGVEGIEATILHVSLSVATGFSVGFYMLGFVGMFSQFFQTHNPWVRYFSDSAYWVFIFHSVPQVIIALAIHNWAMPAEVKFLVMLIGSTMVCLITYQLFVRNSFIGAILNGRRYTDKPWQQT